MLGEGCYLHRRRLSIYLSAWVGAEVPGSWLSPRAAGKAVFPRKSPVMLVIACWVVAPYPNYAPGGTDSLFSLSTP